MFCVIHIIVIIHTFLQVIDKIIRTSIFRPKLPILDKYGTIRTYFDKYVRMLPIQPTQPTQLMLPVQPVRLMLPKSTQQIQQHAIITSQYVHKIHTIPPQHAQSPVPPHAQQTYKYDIRKSFGFHLATSVTVSTAMYFFLLTALYIGVCLLNWYFDRTSPFFISLYWEYLDIPICVVGAPFILTTTIILLRGPGCTSRSINHTASYMMTAMTSLCIYSSYLNCTCDDKRCKQNFNHYKTIMFYAWLYMLSIWCIR